MRDLLKFLSAHMGISNSPFVDSLAICHTPRAADKRATEIGLGWIISNSGAGRLIWHNGATGGYSSYLGFIKEKGVGVCVLTNHSLPLLSAIGLKEPHADEIGQRLLRDLAQDSPAGGV